MINMSIIGLYLAEKNKHSMKTLRKRVHGRIPQCCKHVIQDVSCQVGILYSAVQRPAFVLQIQKRCPSISSTTEGYEEVLQEFSSDP